MESLRKGRRSSKDIDQTLADFLKNWKEVKIIKDTAITGKAKRALEGYFLTLEKKSTPKSLNELLALFIISLIFILFLSLACLSNLLRDITGDPASLNNETKFRRNFADGNPEVVASPPFSLARTQLAVWITIIGSVYTYAVFWDNMDTMIINSTALLLMGISGGTFVAGMMIDKIDIDDKKMRHQDIYTESNFFKNILDDGTGGVSIHRFQNVVWTVIAIFTYFYRYANPLAGKAGTLPELDQTLLALTGISSATYLVLKTKENTSLKKPVNLKMKLLLDNIPEKDAIEKSPDGLKQAIVDIINDKGEKSHASPDSNDPKFSFNGVAEPGRHYKFEVTWKGKVGEDDISLVGFGETDIEPTATSKDVTIQLKK